MRILTAILFSVFAASGMAAEQGNLQTINTGHSPLTDVRAEAEDVRVRIPLKLTAFEQIIVKNTAGQRRYEHKPLAATRYNFKATIDRANHFYVGDWHIETTPEKWDHASKQWTVSLNFFKRYGADQELEENVGKMALVGRLNGKDNLYTFEAQGAQTFRDKNGQPLLQVEINSKAPQEKGNIAKRPTGTGPQ